jgi:hypothetical protein
MSCDGSAITEELPSLVVESVSTSEFVVVDVEVLPELESAPAVLVLVPVLLVLLVLVWGSELDESLFLSPFA